MVSIFEIDNGPSIPSQLTKGRHHSARIRLGVARRTTMIAPIAMDAGRNYATLQLSLFASGDAANLTCASAVDAACNSARRSKEASDLCLMVLATASLAMACTHQKTQPSTISTDAAGSWPPLNNIICCSVLMAGRMHNERNARCPSKALLGCVVRLANQCFNGCA